MKTPLPLKLGSTLTSLAFVATHALVAITSPARADSVVVFNEIMYHPATNEAAMEWVELHNQMSVPVDLSGWAIKGGIDYTFPEGTMMAGGAYLVVAVSPATLMAATGLTNVLGPFTGRLANNGDQLNLRNNNNRLMDSVNYGVEGDWPVAPDGSGASLAKRDPDYASAPAESWTASALIGGTPGLRNFALQPFETVTTTPQAINGTWKFDASGTDLGAAWRQPSFNDTSWTSGSALFQAGNVTPPLGDPEPVPNVFNSGVDANGAVLSPGSADPHYQLTLSAQSTPPPPAIQATVMQNHPAWLANDATSSWIGPINPGTANAAEGNYYFRTTFSLQGFNTASASLKLSLSADNRVNNVLLNNTSRGISFAGFNTWSSEFTISSGFLAGTNTLDFQTANDCCGPNPAGFRVKLSATARRTMPALTTLPSGRTNYYFRTQFTLDGSPALAALKMNTVVADGAVFYLNGTEVLRLNMPGGAVDASTLAVSNVPNPAYLGPYTLPSSALVTGTNVLAVEVHQGPGGTNDVLFGASLQLTMTNILIPPPVTLAFNEFSSATNADFWIEVINYGTSNMDLTSCVLARQGGATNREYVFPSQTLAPGQLVQLPKTTLGFGADPGDHLVLYRADRSGVLDAVVAKREARGRWPDGTGGWWFPTALTPGASNHFAFRDEIVINEIMYRPPGLPAVAGFYGTNLLFTVSNVWRYHNQGQDLGTSWREPIYDDSAWPTSRAMFYNTASLMPAPKLTQLPLTNAAGTRIITWYFRTPFVFNGSTNGAQLMLRPIIDDGAVYYLNGVEFYRQNMPGGEIRYTNLANISVGSPNAFTGPFALPAPSLFSGTNIFAVELHQYTTNPIAADMAFGAELSILGQLTPPLPFREQPESWVELFNRSSNAVDLTGWRLDEGIDFHFPPSTTIPAGGYLVVAKDVGYMQSNYPGITVVGPFTNKLSRGSDFLALKDPSNNLANAVRYFDGGRWPDYADGGGSSLELRDPWSDNSKAESWAASVEAGRSGWNNYSFRSVATNVIGPTLWNEFVLGLLEGGECLIDDLHVVESPTNSPVEMLQNGTFESGMTAWRVLGTHARSRVIVDPDNAANHVLHLIATGPTEHMHNHLETTFASSRSVVNGREYQVSFRAKWLAGNNRLNTRLYFNRVAKTFALPLPSQHGTPGARNSTYATNIGPTFADFRHSPVIPQAAVPVTVSVSVSDPQSVTNISLRWSVNGGAWQSTAMASAVVRATHLASATIPGQSAGAIVQFYVSATDGLGATATFPAGGTNSRALYRVDEGKTLMTQLHRFRLLMTAADTDALHAPTNVMGNNRYGVTVVYDEREVFYDVGLHLQGSQRGRNDTSRVGFTVRFHPDHLFRGVQNGFAMDRSGGYSGKGGKHDEILVWHALNHAGGLPGMYNDIVQVFAPRASEDGTGMLRLAAYGKEFLDAQFNNGSDGNLHKLELIYYPLSTATGDAQAPKSPSPDDVLEVDIKDWGDDPETYRWIYLQENNAERDDYSQIMALCKAFNLTGAALEAQTAQLMDVDEWMRALAFLTLTGTGDTYPYGYNHNFVTYFRPDDGRSMAFLFDMDFCYAQAVDYAIVGQNSANTYRIVTLPNNYRRFYNHIYEITTSTMNSAYLGPWGTRYASLLGQDWSAAVSYVQQRANYVRGTMPLTTSFAITSNGGNNFGTSNSTVALTGTAPISVKEIEVNGVSYPLTWTSLTDWTLTVPLPYFTNLLVAQGVDNFGVRPVNATDSIIVTNLGTPAARPVVINEWMADNAAPGGMWDPVDGQYQDWFEIYNPNATPVNLSGYTLTDNLSLPAKYAVPTNTIIPAHGFLLVWADEEGAQNGTGTNSDLHANFKLSASGEAIGIFAADGTMQHAITFGAQTQNVSQGLFPDGNTNAIVSMPIWTPRATNQIGLPPSPQISGGISVTLGVVSFSFSAVPGRTYRVDYKNDLGAALWTPLGPTHFATETSLNITDNVGALPQRFYRVVLLQ